MDELNQFLSSVEASARRIIKQQSRKAQESAVRERAELTRQGKAAASSTPVSPSPSSSSVSRDELRARYTPGGALVVRAGSSSADEPRSEHDPALSLPRLPCSPSKTGASTASQPAPVTLPALDKSAKKLAKPSPARKNPAAASKLLASPLYKSLAAAQAANDAPNALGGTRAVRRTLRQVDQVSALLRKVGLRDAGLQSPAARTEHAVEKRMCHACWASPDRSTGCEHHQRVLPTGGSGAPLEPQGPLSWQSDDLFVKYRSETDRVALWAAVARLQQQQEQRQLNGEDEPAAVLPEVARHPVWAAFVALLEAENLRTLADSRRRNLAKTFIFDVNHLWLTNLDHFNTSHGRSLEESNSLRDRRDDAAVRNGYSQIPSVSTARALTHARLAGSSDFPTPATSSVTTTDDVPASRRRRRRRRGGFYPLSLLVCGYETSTSASKDVDCVAAWLEQVPGVSLVGSSPVLWWSYPPDRQAELESGKAVDTDAVEFTKAVALFARDAARSSSNAVLVSLVVALDAPVLAPPLFAWHVGSKQPPPCPSASVAPHSTPPAAPQRMSTLVSPASSQLLANPVATRLDTLLPRTLTLLNCMAVPEDHMLKPREEASGHRRDWVELDPDAFRQWLMLSADRCLLPEQFVPVRDVGVSTATPNAPHVGGRYCWHETRAVTGELVRSRTARDYLYVALNLRARGGSNDATLLAAAMAHERLLDVRSGGRLAEYLAVLAARRRQEQREQELREVERKLAAGRLLLEAKRQEQQRVEAALQVAAARAQDRMDGRHGPESGAEGHDAGGTGEDAREWAERVAQSVVEDERLGWERRVLPRDGGVAFFRSVNDQLPARHRFRWQPPVGWDTGAEADTQPMVSPREPTDQGIEREDAADSEDEEDEEDTGALRKQHADNAKAMAAMARELLSDAQFLSLLRDKLGLLPDASDTPSTAATTPDAASSTTNATSRRPDVLTRLGLSFLDEHEAEDATKAGLLATRATAAPIRTRSRPGEGWKRLARTHLPPTFARRVYQPRVEGPRSAFIGRPNVAAPVGMLDPAAWSNHDPPQFPPELRSLFVPRAASDLQDKKTQWAAYERRARSEQPAAHAVAPLAAEEDQQEDEQPQETTMEKQTAKAVLCARNNNLEGLEAALDAGVDVNARDDHGNSLFILACQQGDKRLAKLLMRRRADLNLQNLNGNTALHYLVEYKHSSLADYVRAKGADDTLANAAGLTCYEGLSAEQAAAL